jgi:hypothetical protein
VVDSGGRQPRRDVILVPLWNGIDTGKLDVALPSHAPLPSAIRPVPISIYTRPVGASNLTPGVLNRMSPDPGLVVHTADPADVQKVKQDIAKLNSDIPEVSLDFREFAKRGDDRLRSS